ncbi:MAG: hypothetical protein WBE14_01990, partial [Xanthobacteraceae bacterium]
TRAFLRSQQIRFSSLTVPESHDTGRSDCLCVWLALFERGLDIDPALRAIKLLLRNAKRRVRLLIGRM